MSLSKICQGDQLMKEVSSTRITWGKNCRDLLEIIDVAHTNKMLAADCPYYVILTVHKIEINIHNEIKAVNKKGMIIHIK